VFSLQGVSHVLNRRLLPVVLRSAEAMLLLHNLNDLFEWLFVIDPIFLDDLLMLFPGGTHGGLSRMYDLQ
jgi:hypothetical protein